MQPSNLPSSALQLCETIKNLVEQAKRSVIQTTNRELVFLNWHIGKLLKTEIIKDDRAEYGERIVATVSQELSISLGRGFTPTALFRMIQFYEYFSSKETVATLSQQLSWSHFIELLPLKDPLKIEFYAELCRAEHWSVRTLRNKIQGMLFERTTISKKPEETIRQELKSLRAAGEVKNKELVLRDPYILEFLGLEDTYSERELENAILRDLEKFLLEFGGGFAFVARQKRITISNEDYYIDLLLYHRGMKRLVAIELKLGKFKAAYKGQLELYLRWLDKYERKDGEESPLGIILCAEKDHEQIELLELNKGNIHVAQYLTKPMEEFLKQELHLAITKARLIEREER